MFPGVLALQSLIFSMAGAPVDGTDEVQTFTASGAATTGTFRIFVPGNATNKEGETGDITFSAVAATLVANVQAALDAKFGAGNTLFAGAGPFTFTYKVAMGRADIPMAKITNNLLDGAGTYVVTATTPGVDATLRGIAVGALVWDTTNLVMWVNRGTAVTPNWMPVNDSYRAAGAPTDGVTLANKARTGAIYINTTNGKAYINTNTLASPTWTVIGAQS